MAPTVCRCHHLERMLENEQVVTGPDDLLAAIDGDVTPIDDMRSTARYRRRVMSRVIYQALRNVCPWFRSLG